MQDSISFSERAIPLTARHDIRSHKATYLGKTCWVVKDPVNLKYFRLEPEKFEILQLLDGTKNAEEILLRYHQKFPSKRLTTAQVHQAVLDLYQKGLAWSTRPGQGGAMNYRGDGQKWKQTKQKLSNILFIRLPGIDPTRLLNAGYWIAKWAYHPAVIMWAMAIIVYSWVFMLAHSTEIVQRLPSFESLSTWKCTVTLWLVIGCTKVLHELGHAFACRHANGECHEIGMAFLVFSPCLYCDVSDSWTFPSKWHRIGVAFAGIYVELLIASFAFFGWWHSQPGDLNLVCLLVVVVSSISTLLFNLNPLLRLDGYYILSDWLEIPNLRQRADKALENMFLSTCLGLDTKSEKLPIKTNAFFIFYAIASTIYRAFLVIVICWMLYSILKPWRLEFLGLCLGLISAAIGTRSWFVRIRNSVKSHQRNYGNRRRFHSYISAFVLAGAMTFVFLVPVNFKLKAPLQLEYANSKQIYANSDGQLSAIFKSPGDTVQAGEVILELFSHEETQRLQQLKVARQIQEIEFRKYKVQLDVEKTTIAQENLRSLESEFSDLQAKLQHYQIRAPIDGLISNPLTRKLSASSKRKLARWNGTPIDRLNIGSQFAKGTHLVTVAPARNFHAELMIDQFDVHSIRTGQNVQFKFTHLPGCTFTGEIERVSAASLASIDGDADHRNSAVKLSGENSSFIAIVRINEDQNLFLPGIQGWAKVTIESQTAAQWIWRNVKSTFNFHS